METVIMSKVKPRTESERVKLVIVLVLWCKEKTRKWLRTCIYDAAAATLVNKQQM